MTLGYDKPRPNRGQYHSFLDVACRGLERLGNKDLGLTIYGSFVRGDYIVGESDIDAVLVFPNNVVTDKRFFREVARNLNEARKKTGFPMEDLFQVCPLDIGIMGDGRFNSLTEEFRDYFAMERRVLLGPDYTQDFVYELKKEGDMSALSHNLRKTRIALLHSAYTQENDLPAFVHGFHSTLKAASRASKQLLHLTDGKLRLNRFSALEELQRVFPEVDVKPLVLMRRLYTNPKDMDKVYRNPVEALGYWNSFMTFFEEVVRAYQEKFPRTT